jgi:predicted nucleic acid-binding protein
MPRLEDAIAGVTRIGLDTMSVIYYVEANPTYLPLMDVIFDRIDEGNIAGVASTITLLEVLVQPLRRGTSDIADQYRDLLTDSANFEILPLTEAVAETAADLRARYNLRTADSVVAATAIQAGCQALVTNDDRLPRVTELRIISLSDITL